LVTKKFGRGKIMMDSTNTDSMNAVRELFAKARDLPVNARSDWLHTNCADIRIRNEVLDLLRYDIDDPFMEKPLVAPKDHDATHSYRPSPVLSSKLFAGRYKLLQSIGEGGFGVVYMAEQIEPVRRRVAIKLLKSSMDSKSVVVRFESERQALAMMDHPNIARVFDGGVAEDGTPYFVMELVNGVPITEFCDANHLTHTDRMKLLMTVCNAVQHAHQKGIIHRDLKPSNILVSLLDGTPVPKVIDFGIAKALHGPLTDKTLFTSFQQMIGTPEYMSPEQAETSILDIDTRSDVFSLGVLAYELLTGTTPFDGRALRKLAYAEIQRTIREVDPPKPSDRISTLGEQAVSIAIKHGISQGNMRKTIRGDLDWIVMKSMEKDRNRRYGSAQSMADDLRRWIQEEPIEARPPSFVYRTTKLIRRNRTRFAVAAIVTVGAILTAMGFGYGLSERNASLLRQKDARQRTEQLQALADVQADRNRSLRYGNAMIAAHESFQSGRRATTLELLAECPEDKRGIEWKWLNRLASDQTEILMQTSTKNAQRAIVYAGAVSKVLPTSARGWETGTEHRLYSAGADGMLRLWNTDNHQELQSWRIANESIAAMQISPTDSSLLVATESGQVVLWDTVKGQVVESVSQGKKITTVAIFYPDESQSARFAIGCDDGTILIWHSSLSSDCIRLENKKQPFQGAIQSLQFNGDGTELLAAGKGGVTLFDATTGDLLQQAGQSWQSYSSLFANSLGRIILFGPPVATVDSTTLASRKLIEVTSTGIWTGDYVAKDESLIIATEDQCLRRIYLQSGVQETLGYCSGTIVKLAAPSDGHSVAMIDDTGSLRLLGKESYACPVVVQAFAGEISSIAVENCDAVYCLSDQGDLLVWNANRNTELARENAHHQQGFSLALSAKNGNLVSNGLDQRLTVWSTRSERVTAGYDLSLGARYIALHPDGKHLAGPMPMDLSEVASSRLNLSECEGSNLAYWNLETGKVERCFLKLSNWAMKLRFSSGGSMLAAATISDGAVVWPLDSDVSIRLSDSNQPQVGEVAFSKDEKHLFAGCRNGRVYVWNIETQELERKMVCHGDQISGLLVTADGARVVTSSTSDSTIRVWDWQTGQKTAEFEIGSSGVSELHFADDEGSLVVASKDGRIHRLKIR
jgi:eukaryotic-like serine/threonine-protein kinase